MTDPRAPQTARDRAASPPNPPGRPGRHAPATRGAAEPIRCLVCGSTNVERDGRLLANLLAAVIALLAGAPEGAAPRARYRCAICSYRWRDGDRLEGRVPGIG